MADFGLFKIFILFIFFQIVSQTRILNCSSPSVKGDVLQNGLMWLIKAGSDYHFDILFNNVVFKGSGNIFVGPGDHPNASVGVLLTRARQVRVAQSVGFVYLNDVMSDDLIQFQVRCWLFKMPVTTAIVMPTRYVPLENDIIVDACLKYLDRSTLDEFLTENSTLKEEFEKKLIIKTLSRLSIDDECWQKDKDGVESYIIWPIFIHTDETNENLYTVCFKVSVTIISSKNCTITQSELENIVKNLGNLMDGSVVVTLVAKKLDFFAYIAFGIAILTLTSVLFSGIWYKQWRDSYTKPAKKKEIEDDLAISTWPSVSINPIHGLDLDFDDYETESNKSSIQNEEKEKIEKIELPVNDFSNALTYVGKLTPKLPRTILSSTNVEPKVEEKVEKKVEEKVEEKQENVVQFSQTVECVYFASETNDETAL